MKKESFILFMLLNIFTISSAQDYHLQLHIEDMQYDSLFLKGTIGDKFDYPVYISGTTLDATNWDFLVPDSIYNSCVYFVFAAKPKNTDLNTKYYIILNAIQNRDTLKVANFFLDRKIKKIDMKYLESATFKDQLFYWIKSDDGKGGIDRESYTADIRDDHFQIPYFHNTDFALSFTYRVFGEFYPLESDTIQYDEYLTQYLKIIEKYPDSRYLISQIANNLQFYKTKEDLQKLYDAFSKVNKQTYLGKKISNYIDTHYTFSDTLLPTGDTGILEPIIQDSTKINLVIFSASWCKPCREEIPLLKQIYNDLKECVSFTYISEDSPKYVDNWKNLMQQENIPWRSLLAVNDVAAIKKKYNAVAIPYILLVYPNKRVEVIDVKIKEDKDKLYSLCGK